MWTLYLYMYMSPYPGLRLAGGRISPPAQLPPGALAPCMHPPTTQAPLLGCCCCWLRVAFPHRPSYLQGPRPISPTPHRGTPPGLLLAGEISPTPHRGTPPGLLLLLLLLLLLAGGATTPPPPGTLRTLRTCGPTLKHPSPG